MDRDLKCEICNISYDIETRFPICIPCGHTLCLLCLKEKYDKDGKIRCNLDNKIFNLKPEQYAKNHFILKLIQSKKTVITNINFNKNINLVNNNNISISSKPSSFRSENVNSISYIKEEYEKTNNNNLNNISNNNISNKNNNITLKVHNDTSNKKLKIKYF